ncbi:hypothetical protein ACVCIH_28745 [Burkholderia glumae]|uniref:hypothetical protein n=1 Tax=Burkholderia glumae TaxID=337 RepID=UPI0020367480|nr:hypothetical protein [Burkholderia glumae]MCM2495896.1 hypothetical protein [Burkholderia glumae]
MMIMKRVPSCLVRGGRHAVNAARRQYQYRTGPAGCAATLVLFSPRRRVRRGTGALAPIACEIADTSLELPRRAAPRRAVPVHAAVVNKVGKSAAATGTMRVGGASASSPRRTTTVLTHEAREAPRRRPDTPGHDVPARPPASRFTSPGSLNRP